MRLSRLLLSAAACLCMAASPAMAVETGSYEFVAIGDVPYHVPEDLPGWGRLIAAINAAGPAFALHVGDFKKGSSPCSDEQFATVLASFGTLDPPLIYTPGDNEWTDCHRAGADPLERLAALRRQFFPPGESLGRQRLALERQAPPYVENARWHLGPVVYATVHLVGSNNNLLRDDPAAFQEYLERTRADISWLRETYQAAARRGAKGVVIATQADPGFEKWDGDRSGYNSFLEALTREVKGFPGQTLFIHGDSHVFRVDKPLKRGDPSRELMRFTRAEVFAEKDLHAVRVRVDPADPAVFSFGVLAVPDNLTAEGYSR